MDAEAENCTTLAQDTDFELCLHDVYVFPNFVEWTMLPIFVVFFFVGIVGNALVVFVVIRNESMLTVTNVFLVNLALADFLVILWCMPFSILVDYTFTWFFGKALCKIVAYINTVSISVSILTLTSISIERWYAICRPLAFRATLSRTIKFVVIVWLVSLVIALPELIILEPAPFDFTLLNRTNFTSYLFWQCTDTWGGDNQKVYQLVQTTCLFLLPLVLMSVTYSKIVRVLWSTEIPSDPLLGASTRPVRCNVTITVQEAHDSRMSPASYRTSADSAPSLRKTSSGRKNTNQQEREIGSRRKAAKMLIAIVALFAICYLPVNLRNVLECFECWPSFDYPFDTLTLLTMRVLCYFSSCCNPIIYNFMSAKFKREFRNALCCSEAAPSSAPTSRKPSGYYSRCSPPVHANGERAAILGSAVRSNGSNVNL